MATIDDNMVEDGKSGIEEQMSWEADESMIWDSGPDEAAEYLNAADEARKLTEILENQCLNSEEDKELLGRAHDVLQTAMLRLGKEFKRMLFRYRRPFEPEHTSFRSSEDVSVDESSIISCGDPNISRTSVDFIIDLVHPHVIPDLKCIANLMFMSKYGHECCQAFVIVRKDALDDCLFNLEMENLSIEDVARMEWGNLSSKIKKWVRAIKVFVRHYLASEKWLCNQIFAGLGSAGLLCFIEVAKDSLMQLLNYAAAIPIGSHRPENLFEILDMYAVLVALLPDIDALFLDEAGSSIRIEINEILRRLGDSVRPTLLELENVVASNASTNPLAGGRIHGLTRYVMNYIQLLAEYRDTLNLLLKNQEGAAASPLSPDRSCFPMAVNFHSLTSILEVNLYDKSKLYKDASLQHFFLMNNIHYMAQKVKNSELRLIFGDRWIREHNGKIQKHAMDYERATWSSILLLLSYEISSSSISRTFLRERLRSFYVAFEKVYRTQTAWHIPDVQLREELRISISQKVTLAYWSFLGLLTINYHVGGEKLIKYAAEDLQDYLLDLFEGTQKSLHNCITSNTYTFVSFRGERLPLYMQPFV